MAKTLQNLLTYLSNIGADPNDSDEERLKKSIFSVGLLVAILVLICVGFLYIVFNEPLAGSVWIGFALYSLVNFVWYASHHDLRRLTRAISIPVLPVHLLLVVLLGSFVNAGAVILWGLLAPVFSEVIFYGMRSALPYIVLYAVNVVVTAVLQLNTQATTNVPPAVTQFIFALNILTVSGIIVAILAYFLYQRDLAFRLLHGEQVKAENLLLNILPPEIASILKNETRTIAEHFDGASILFADVVNFTPMSNSMTAVELVNLLNEVFSDFDTLVEKYELEKIKTIGDCYMVASGVPRPRPDHAHALVRMALEMQTHVQEHEFNGKRLNFRIGINSGPVVAGVIGRKKFIYDLWGDAVNTASRMESHGAGGAIQITRSTHDLIKDDFVCEARGVAAIKGKGDMEVWFVVGEKQPQPA